MLFLISVLKINTFIERFKRTVHISGILYRYKTSLRNTMAKQVFELARISSFNDLRSTHCDIELMWIGGDFV